MQTRNSFREIFNSIFTKNGIRWWDDWSVNHKNIDYDQAVTMMVKGKVPGKQQLGNQQGGAVATLRQEHPTSDKSSKPMVHNVRHAGHTLPSTSRHVAHKGYKRKK